MPVVPVRSPRANRLTVAALLFVVGACLAPRPAAAADAAADFSPVANSVNERWSYGMSPTRGGVFTLFTGRATNPPGLDFWADAASGTKVSHNSGFSPITFASNTTVPPGGLNLHPGTGGQFAVVRWNAREAGTATVVARFLRRSTDVTATEVAILHGSAVVYSRWLSHDAGDLLSISLSLPVVVGDHLDFVVGPGDGSTASNTIGLDATVNLEPAVNPAGPVISFAGQRFVACLGDPAFEAIAFDPVNRRLATPDTLRDLCGSSMLPGPSPAPGLTWDSVTNTYWQVTSTRQVRRWTAAGVLIATVFTVPLTFNVPGWGLDTLDAPKGIAVDSNFVYLVDAGDPGVQGQIHANEWFKFTRAGVPVKSSKLTNFHANLDMNPDAVVDDIVYVPFSAPYLKGKLLIALEHSGIQVIDTDGNFVSKFRWTDAGVPPGVKLFGFAGLTIDPLTGNLYLVENSGGVVQIWTRLPSNAATWYAVGSGSSAPRLHYPNSGCNRPLYNSLPADAGLVFGNTYRSADRSIYGLDFGSSQLYRYAPSTGAGGRVVVTGATGGWGVAYDTERDVLYTGLETNGPSGLDIRLVAIDPVTGAVDPRPNKSGYYTTDLAFNSVDRNLYGVASLVAGTRLIRIDRNTGLGTIVGPTVAVSGIDWDATSGRLIGIQNNGGTAILWSINPATGASTNVANLGSGAGSEGLAIVPVPAASTVSVAESIAPESGLLSVWPNPARGATTMRFALPAAASVDVAVFDVAGRRIRALGSRTLAAGAHSIAWDGRDEEGRPAASGVYFARVEHGGRTMVARIVRAE